MTKQAAKPTISKTAKQMLDTYEDYLTSVLDLRPATIRNYISDLRLFIAWCERSWQNSDSEVVFLPKRVATPTVTRYRDYLQRLLHQRDRKSKHHYFYQLFCQYSTGRVWCKRCWTKRNLANIRYGDSIALSTLLIFT